MSDAYGRPVDGTNTYSPFVAGDVKELPDGSPEVEFEKEAPARADMTMDRALSFSLTFRLCLLVH